MGHKTIARFTPQGDSYKRSDILIGYRPDNLKWASDDKLLIGGQRLDTFKDCGAVRCRIAGTVAVLDTRSMSVREVYRNSGDTYSNLTTGLAVGEDLWLGSVDEGRVAIVRKGNPVSRP